MRTAILVSTPVETRLEGEVAAGLRPKPDFFALAEALDAALITPVGTPLARLGRVSKSLSLFRAAWTAFRRRDEYDLIISDLDRVGVILALLFKLFRVKRRHVLICHGNITRSHDMRLVRALRLDHHIDRFVCYGAAVAKRLERGLNLGSDRVVTVRHAVDHGFWRPLPVPAERLIVSAGMLNRDYDTLIKAVNGLDVSLAVAAHSPWVATRKSQTPSESLPANVHFLRCTYHELRAMYARALFVAVPLSDSHLQAGSLVVYEAMAMGKAVVTTGTEGQTELNVVTEGQTGHLLATGDMDGWRKTIQRLLDHPEQAVDMGRRARAAVEAGLSQDGYVRHMVGIVNALRTQEDASLVS